MSGVLAGELEVLDRWGKGLAEVSYRNAVNTTPATTAPSSPPPPT